MSILARSQKHSPQANPKIRYRKIKNKREKNMIQVPKNNKFIKTRSRLRQENPKKEVEPIAPNTEAESQTKYTI